MTLSFKDLSSLHSKGQSQDLNAGHHLFIQQIVMEHHWVPGSVQGGGNAMQTEADERPVLRQPPNLCYFHNFYNVASILQS